VAFLLQTLGSWLAMAHAGYAIFLGLGCAFGVHAAVLVAMLCATTRKRWVGTRLRWLILPVEVVYGLLNPLVYLIVLVHVYAFPGLVPPTGQPGWIRTPAWLLLVALWGVRILGRHPEQDGERPRRVTRAVLSAAFVLVVAFPIKDAPPMVAAAASNWQPTHSLWAIVMASSWMSLYLVPLVLLRAHLRVTASPAAWTSDRRFLLGNLPGVRPAALSLVTVAALSVLASLRWSSEASVRALVLERREAIVTAARRQRIDPRLLASLVYVVQRDTVSPLSLAVEQLVMGAWLFDVRDELGLAGALDAAIGLTQIKPTTAIHAAQIHLAGTAGERELTLWDKDLRPILPVEPYWKLPAQSFVGITSPFVLPLKKPQVVAQLLTDDGSLAVAAFLLALYERQWRAVYPNLDLAQRPEITATLYQLGFARSRPHDAPRANQFGEAVGEVFRSPWIEEHFGTSS
jgi:hypothetical protein